MNKHIIAIFLVICMALSLVACDSKGDVISSEKAQQIVLDDLGISADEAEVHVHAGELNGVVCYSIYVTVDGETLAYLVSAATGEILSVEESDHSH